MTKLDRACEIAGLDRQSLNSAGRAKVICVEAKPPPAGIWYDPRDDFHYHGPLIHIDLWAVKPGTSERAEFVLRKLDGTVVTDSRLTQSPRNEFFAFPIEVMQSVFDEIKALPD